MLWVLLAALNSSPSHTPTERLGRMSAAVTLALFGPPAPVEALGSLATGETTYRVVYLATAVLLAALVWLSWPSATWL